MVKGGIGIAHNSGGDDCCDSGTESDFLVVDENSPLLVTLHRPDNAEAWELRKPKEGYNTYMQLKRIRRKTGHRKLPRVIVFTAMGMAAMVVIGIVSMFQDPTAINSLVDNNSPPISPSSSSNASTSANLVDSHSDEHNNFLLPQKNGSAGLNNSSFILPESNATSGIL